MANEDRTEPERDALTTAATYVLTQLERHAPSVADEIAYAKSRQPDDDTNALRLMSLRDPKALAAGVAEVRSQLNGAQLEIFDEAAVPLREAGINVPGSTAAEQVAAATRTKAGQVLTQLKRHAPSLTEPIAYAESCQPHDAAKQLELMSLLDPGKLAAGVEEAARSLDGPALERFDDASASLRRAGIDVPARSESPTMQAIGRLVRGATRDGL